MKLGLLLLANYLPHDLKGINHNGELISVDLRTTSLFLSEAINLRPILKPLSDIRIAVEEIYNESWMAMGYTLAEDENGIHILSTEDESTLSISIEKPWTNMQWVNDVLYRLHYDLHGLIDEGLAIDINKLSAVQKSPV